MTFPSLQAIEDEGGNPDEIEISSEGSKKALKRSSKGREGLSEPLPAHLQAIDVARLLGCVKEGFGG